MDPQILLITLSGILIVFVVLLLLVFIFTAFGKLMSNAGGKKKEEKKVRAEKAKPSKPAVAAAEIKKAAAPAPAVENGIPGSVIAAIAAAIAVMGEADGNAYTVRSVRRERSSRSVWAAAGIIENTRPF